MVYGNVALVPSVVETTGVSKREFVNTVLNCRDTAWISDQDPGHDMIAIHPGREYGTYNVSLGTTRNQIIWMEKCERPWGLELIADLLETGLVPGLVTPRITQWVIRRVDPSNATLVHGPTDRRCQFSSPVLMDLSHR